MLEVCNLSKSFGKNKVLDNISFSVNNGDIISIVGPSGGGKSTLLRCINLLEKSKGTIKFNGKKIDNMIGKNIGMVFQQFNLFPHLSVIENILLAPTKLKLMSREEALEKAYDLLKTIGLESKANSFPNELSGGQKQRVAIIRTLMMDPDIILFDEPTSALDPVMKDEVLDLIKEIADSGKTMLIVSHEMNFVRNVANRVLFLDGGKIIFDGSTEKFLNCNEKKIKDFIGKI